jgi:hypothetical protein
VGVVKKPWVGEGVARQGKAIFGTYHMINYSPLGIGIWERDMIDPISPPCSFGQSRRTTFRFQIVIHYALPWSAQRGRLLTYGLRFRIALCAVELPIYIYDP